MIVSRTTPSLPAASRPSLAAMYGSRPDFASVLSAASSSNGLSASAANPLFAAPMVGKSAGLSATGRNEALFDPESAYQMMSTINQKEVLYKAQYASLKGLGDSLPEMGALGRKLADLPDSAGAGEIGAVLQEFTDAYNRWSQKFGDQTDPGGVLADTRAAKIARRALEQSIANIFTGAQDGFHGLKDLGLTLSPVTHRASFDSSRLDAALKTAPSGALATVREFGAGFSKSATLLVSAGNFIPGQLNNLDRAIGFIAKNHSALQSEFGTGDPPKTTGVIAQALAVYKQLYGS